MGAKTATKNSESTKISSFFSLMYPLLHLTVTKQRCCSRQWHRKQSLWIQRWQPVSVSQIPLCHSERNSNRLVGFFYFSLHNIIISVFLQGYLSSLAAEQAVIVDTQGGSQPNSLHYTDCNWTLRYEPMYKLIFYGMPGQIKSWTFAWEEAVTYC